MRMTTDDRAAIDKLRALTGLTISGVIRLATREALATRTTRRRKAA